MLDTVMRGTTVLDGMGGPCFGADVGVVDGRIAVVGPEITHEAARAIEARGYHLTRGFIDPHSHSKLTMLVDPRAESKIRQGVTLISADRSAHGAGD